MDPKAEFIQIEDPADDDDENEDAYGDPAKDAAAAASTVGPPPSHFHTPHAAQAHHQVTPGGGHRPSYWVKFLGSHSFRTGPPRVPLSEALISAAFALVSLVVTNAFNRLTLGVELAENSLLIGAFGASAVLLYHYRTTYNKDSQMSQPWNAVLGHVCA
ncbi:hypothetical protein DFJ73DRAFT_848625 [Zopfochytrium polystomum]|nr:hypothetical protein DFJ73DRAFT_848625 [Zopfochytrium polystomum]